MGCWVWALPGESVPAASGALHRLDTVLDPWFLVWLAGTPPPTGQSLDSLWV